MSTDKYPCIFLPQMEAITIIILFIYHSVYLKLSLSYLILYGKMKTTAWQLPLANLNWKLQLARLKLSIKYHVAVEVCKVAIHQRNIPFDCKVYYSLYHFRVDFALFLQLLVVLIQTNIASIFECCLWTLFFSVETTII